MAKKENLLEALYITLLMVCCVGLFVVSSMLFPRGACHKTEVNYYYDVTILVSESDNGKNVCYQAVISDSSKDTLIDLLYDKVYVFHQNSMELNDNTLKETTYTSLFFNRKETDYELYIFL